MSGLPLLAGFGFLIGACAGSFVATSALRSTAGLDAMSGRSRCDACAVQLSYFATLPIASFIARRGRCANCQARIALAHPVAEVAGGLVVATTMLLAPAEIWIPSIVLGLLLVYLATYDGAILRLPDWATLAVGAGGLFVSAWRGELISSTLTATLTLASLTLAVRGLELVRRHQVFGGGDVKLLTALGFWAGPTLMPIGLVLAACAALAWMASRGRLQSGDRLAFGPFIAAAFWPIVLGRLSA